MAELHVLGEKDALADDVRGEDFEDHIGERSSRKHVAPDELAEHVQLIRVDVGDTLHDATGDPKLVSDCKRGEVRPQSTMLND